MDLILIIANIIKKWNNNNTQTGNVHPILNLIALLIDVESHDLLENALTRKIHLNGQIG